MVCFSWKPRGVCVALSRNSNPTILRSSRQFAALYRPGPIENGDMQDYIDRKNGTQPIIYGHPSFEGALRSTYGVCIYQEQVMQIAHDVAGFTFAEADVFRKYNRETE